MQKTKIMHVWSLGWEDFMEEGTEAHTNILAGESHGQRSLVGYSQEGCKELETIEVT